MEPINQFIFFFYNLFTDKNLENDFFINKIIKSLNYLFLIIKDNSFFVFCFLILLIAVIYLNYKNQKNYKLIYILNILIFFVILILFPVNIPFTDTYMEIAILFDQSVIDYLIYRSDEGFLFTIFRLLHVIIYKFFNLNYSIIIYLNFFLYVFTFYLVIKCLEKFELHNHILFFILIYFNGKWFVHFYEPVNIVWTINFFLVTLFVYSLSIQNLYSKNFLLLLIYILTIINFKAGVIIYVYSVLYGICLKKDVINRIFFIFVPVIIFILINKLTIQGLEESSNSMGFYFDLIFKEDYFLIIKTSYLIFLANFIALHSLIFNPMIYQIKFLSITFGLVQYSYLFYQSFFNKNKFFNNLRNFIIENPFIIMGSLGCLLIAATRENYFHSRYMTFSLLFQIGFLIFIFRHNYFKRNINLIKKNLVVFLFLIIYFINLFLSSQGFFFAFKKNYINNDVKNCLINNPKKHNCLPDMFYSTFYDNDEKHYKVFMNDVYKLKDLGLSVFHEIKSE